MGGRRHTEEQRHSTSLPGLAPSDPLWFTGLPGSKKFLTSVPCTSSWPLILKRVSMPCSLLNFVMTITLGADLEQTTSFACERLDTIARTPLMSERLINIYWRASWFSRQACSCCTPLSAGHQAPAVVMEEAGGTACVPSGRWGHGGPQWHATGWLCFVKAVGCLRENEQYSRERPLRPSALFSTQDHNQYPLPWMAIRGWHGKKQKQDKTLFLFHLQELQRRGFW